MVSAKLLAAVLDKISEWSIYVVIFTLPFGKSIVEIAIVTALISFALRKMLLKEKISFDRIDILLLIFLLVSLPSFINTHYMSLSLRGVFSKCQVLATSGAASMRSFRNRNPFLAEDLPTGCRSLTRIRWP